MADQLENRSETCTRGAIIPGLGLAGLYALYAFFVTMNFPRRSRHAAGGIGLTQEGRQRGSWSLMMAIHRQVLRMRNDAALQ